MEPDVLVSRRPAAATRWDGGTARPPHGARGASQAYLMRMMTEGVCAIAPIMLQTHITHRKVRKASWHPGLGHFPGTTVAFSGGPPVRHAQPVRFWKEAFGPFNWGISRA